MRAPMSWLREYVDLPAELSGRDLATALIGVGLEVETVDTVGADVNGPVVIGQVQRIAELTGFRKPIRYCAVDVGAENGGVRGIVCGATNFAVGDLVVVALPGSVLPGGFAISARETYGHTSDGMICSVAELSLGEDSSGILVLPAGTAPVGSPAAAVLGLGDEVLDIAVTPDRGYAMSLRGLAREAAIALGLHFTDPADRGRLDYPSPTGPVQPVVVADSAACTEFTAVHLSDVNPNADSPWWLQRRLAACGMRSVSLAVDVTNYVMLELGQPLHAFDAAALRGAIVVRRAKAGESLTTLDHVARPLDGDDLLITDDRGPIGLAGIMGGLDTEISATTTEIVLEAAHFAPDVIARMARRHKLPSEASRRFERGVDPALPWVASKRAAELLVGLGGGVIGAGLGVGGAEPAAAIPFDPALPARVSGAAIAPEEVSDSLQIVGARIEVTGDDQAARWLVTPPSWRPDLRDPADLVEEVVRIHGYQHLPATLPSPPAGRGLTPEQRLRRAASRALASFGLVEVLCYPFVGQSDYDALGLAQDDGRRRSTRLANPLSDEQGLLRTTLLPGLLTCAKRNLGRGRDGVALYETGLVFLPPEESTVPVSPGVDRRPSDGELAGIGRALPLQPHHAGVVFAGVLEQPGWWGPGRDGGWPEAIESARDLAAAVGVAVTIVPEPDVMPWHPGRCAAVQVDGVTIGHAGELHPRVVAAVGLPPRSAAMELDLDALIAAAPRHVGAPQVSTHPVAKEDVALIVGEEVPAAAVVDSLLRGSPELLESVRLFDEYTGSQIPPGHKSLAFALRFRAPDRTLTEAEVTAARDSAVAAVREDHEAVLRSV
jgi:phenylalanyl-tRNA synthetase beta chain